MVRLNAGRSIVALALAVAAATGWWLAPDSAEAMTGAPPGCRSDLTYTLSAPETCERWRFAAETASYGYKRFLARKAEFVASHCELPPWHKDRAKGPVAECSKPTPYEAYDWTTDRCSPPTPPAWKVTFSGPCEQHDFGYRNFGKGLSLSRSERTRKWIDDNFLKAMRAVCSTRRPGTGRRSCNDVAKSMWLAVRGGQIGQLWGWGRRDSTTKPPDDERLSVGGFHSCAVLALGRVSCWGFNSSGQLGNGTTSTSSSPVTVIGIDNARSVSSGFEYSCAVLSGGPIECWGSNRRGQLGDGTLTDSSTPVRVAGIDNARAVSSGGGATCAVLTTGSVSCWGWNTGGQLGDRTTTDRATPVSVPGIRNAVAVSGGVGHACALLNTGGIKCWGSNSFGALGNGTTQDSRAPVTVRGITTATAISVNSGVCAVIRGGRVKCWGFLDPGKPQATPKYVAGIEDAVSVSAGPDRACAVLATGGVKCWGRENDSGQLGDGTRTATGRPVSVVGISSARSVSAGRNFFACAALISTEVRCWGGNAAGELGDGTTTDSASPVPVRGLGISFVE